MARNLVYQYLFLVAFTLGPSNRRVRHPLTEVINGEYDPSSSHAFFLECFDPWLLEGFVLRSRDGS